VKKPTIFVGNYLDVIKHLLSEEYIELLKPKVIWIEYQVIPVFELSKALQNQPHLADQLFFLELPTIDALEQLFKSSELFSVSQHGFSTIIIHIMKYCLLPHDIQIRLRELGINYNVILITDKLTLPRNQINLVQVESRK
jgi:hypothetical protein